MSDPGPERGDADRDARPTRDASWRTLHLWQIQPIRDVLLIAAIFGLFWLGARISLVTVPLLLALLLAYLFEPIVGRLAKSQRFGRRGAAALILAAVVIVVVIPVGAGATWAVASGLSTATRIGGNLIELRDAVVAEPGDETSMQRLPNDGWRSVAETLRETRERVRSRVAPDGGAVAPETDTGAEGTADDGIDVATEADDDAEPGPAAPLVRGLTFLAGQVEAWLESDAQGIGRAAISGGVGFVSLVTRAGGAIGVLLFMSFLTAFFFFFVSTGYPKTRDLLESVIPSHERERAFDLLGKMDRVVAGFVRGRLTIMVIQCVVFSILYFLAGVPAALLVGVAVGVLSVVPYLALIGIPAAILLMFLDPPSGFRGTWWWMTLAPTAVYFGVQALDDYVLTPSIQGKATDMDTPTVLFASLAGGVLAGVYGLLIAIPVAACLKILVKEVLWPRVEAWAEGRERDPLPLADAKDPDG